MTRLRNPLETLLTAALLTLGFVDARFAAAGALLFIACEIGAGIRGRRGPRWIPLIWPAGDVPLTIVYDGTCRLCEGSKRKLERWKTAGLFTFITAQSETVRTLLPGTSEAQLLGQMHVLEEGRVYGGADGWFRIMRYAPLWSAWLAWVAPRFLARPLYRWIARNRYHWFGRTACENGSCAIPDAGARRSSTPNDSRDPS